VREKRRAEISYRGGGKVGTDVLSTYDCSAADRSFYFGTAMPHSNVSQRSAVT
jgi:hypothetical protein